MAPSDKGEKGAQHKPKTSTETRHKVVIFGDLHGSELEEYKYMHQRVDLVISKGDIPVGFCSYIDLNEGHPIFLETREGVRVPHHDTEAGPQFQITWRKEREVIAAGMSNPGGWYSDLDELYTAVLAYFERKSILSEETLSYLDADPFVRFGINDPITQQALQKLRDTPALLCVDSVPSEREWADYLRINLDDMNDEALKWIVQAFAETELPRPWTCYKGVGSIICYIRTDSGLVQWKHPFYNHFKQLRDYCRQASEAEVMQVRVNRLMWSYEATRVETEHDQDPLICPSNIARMGEIFGYDIKFEGYLVRNLKSQLRTFATDYRKNQNIELDRIKKCADLLVLDKNKFFEMQEHWSTKLGEATDFELASLANSEIDCVNCQKTALCFCLECKDYLCINCYEQLHNKGARVNHAPFRLLPCSNCVDKPAKLHCTFTDKSLCHKCYALEHIKTLPADGKENQPRRIDYLQQYTRYANIAQKRSETQQQQGAAAAESGENHESVLNTDWHPFYDVRGVKFYHNFFTGERMRQSPRRVPNENDPGVPDHLAMAALEDSKNKNRNHAILTGFNSLRSEEKAVDLAATNPDFRNLRAPHRVHMPMEVEPM